MCNFGMYYCYNIGILLVYESMFIVDKVFNVLYLNYCEDCVGIIKINSY